MAGANFDSSPLHYMFRNTSCTTPCVQFDVHFMWLPTLTGMHEEMEEITKSTLLKKKNRHSSLN